MSATDKSGKFHHRDVQRIDDRMSVAGCCEHCGQYMLIYSNTMICADADKCKKARSIVIGKGSKFHDSFPEQRVDSKADRDHSRLGRMYKDIKFGDRKEKIEA